jgi:hypothetical protein
MAGPLQGRLFSERSQTGQELLFFCTRYRQDLAIAEADFSTIALYIALQVPHIDDITVMDTEKIRVVQQQVLYLLQCFGYDKCFAAQQVETGIILFGLTV